MSHAERRTSFRSFVPEGNLNAYACPLRLSFLRPLIFHSLHSLTRAQIAINYPARAYGISRHETIKEALKKVHLRSGVLSCSCGRPLSKLMRANARSFRADPLHSASART